jgi:trk system potassium uptake protein TrkH
MRLSPLFFVSSVTLLVMGDLMLIPAAVGWFSDSGWVDSAPFLNAAAITLVPALIVFAVTKRPDITIVPRQAFAITSLVWLVVASAGAIPFAFHEHMSVTDSFFESMSGITTTGSTVMVGLDETAASLLLWRSILQWIGGLGFMMMAIAILPLVGVGGMRLFRSESSDWSEKSLPRTKDLALHIGGVYLALTSLCAASYWALGMSVFDAINHAMTTLATGGYSTSDQSMGKLYLQAFRQGLASLVRDDQVSFFLRMVAIVVGGCTAVLVSRSDMGAWEALTVVTFNAISTISTTGYASADYTLWGEFFVGAFLFLMFTGGCSGSTAGSIKAFRIQIALMLINRQIKRLVHPRGVFVEKLNNQRIDEDVSGALIAFIFAVGLTVIVATVALTALNIDFVTALSSAATAVTNVGPGLGPIVGPAGNFSTLPDLAKWILSGAMLMGRLELMTVIVLFSSSYWRS